MQGMTLLRMANCARHIVVCITGNSHIADIVYPSLVAATQSEQETMQIDIQALNFYHCSIHNEDNMEYHASSRSCHQAIRSSLDRMSLAWRWINAVCLLKLPQNVQCIQCVYTE